MDLIEIKMVMLIVIRVLYYTYKKVVMEGYWLEIQPFSLFY